MFYQPCLRAKEFFRETILVPFLRRNILLSTVKTLSMCKIGSRVLDSRHYVEKYQRKRVACYCYQKLRQTNFFKKNFGKCSQIGCFKVRNSTRKTLTLRQSPSNGMLQNKSFAGVIKGNVTRRSPRENMHKLFGCILTTLKLF